MLQSDHPRLLLSPRDAARALSICPKTLWSWTAPRGPIPAINIGRSVRYAVSDLQAFIESRRAQGGEQ